MERGLRLQKVTLFFLSTYASTAYVLLGMHVAYPLVFFCGIILQCKFLADALLDLFFLLKAVYLFENVLYPTRKKEREMHLFFSFSTHPNEPSPIYWTFPDDIFTTRRDLVMGSPRENSESERKKGEPSFSSFFHLESFFFNRRVGMYTVCGERRLGVFFRVLAPVLQKIPGLQQTQQHFALQQENPNQLSCT